MVRKVFGELHAKVDKYAGFIVGDSAAPENILCPWDSNPKDVEGRLLICNTEIWSGQLFLAEEIEDVLRPFSDDERTIAKTFATRPGKPGKPKLKLRTRLMGDSDGKFELQRCSAGGELDDIITEFEIIDTQVIRLEVNGVIRATMFDPHDPIHQKRLQRLRS